MRHTFLLLVFLFASLTSFSQTVNFLYDNSGNRTSRTTITMKSTHSDSEDQNSQESFTDQLDGHAILIYPNPVKSEINIEIQGLAEDMDAEIRLFDQSGRLLILQNHFSESSSMNLTEFSAGNYYMVIRLGTETTRWTIIKE